MEKVIKDNKPELIDWLKSDSLIILQHVQAKGLITALEYDKLKSITIPSYMVIELLDFILVKGENACRDFLILLKKDNVNEFSPELRKWIETVDTSETANTAGHSGIQVTSKIYASGGSNVYSPKITAATIGSIQMNMTVAPSGKSNVATNCQKPDRDCERRENGSRSIQDYQKFLKDNNSQLVQKVKNIDPIIDDLIKFLHDESIANVRANPTLQKKMRELLGCVNCESIAKAIVDALFKHEESLMKELLY
ncbi:uncharacterized protein si:dkey-10c21.1 isoform X1 [Megalobrama amblycephala]|uniref:uncharacterized protein si:dkey-10c21.1 isoform X1 n=1 Tax=Megalobrama amblycephala TaxID=75352 RepID=UPI002014043A|nr:uncharacterized protein si:dkey-10c21.1 isoform X1 [Megalobrama amblycephala]